MKMAYAHDSDFTKAQRVIRTGLLSRQNKQAHFVNNENRKIWEQVYKACFSFLPHDILKDNEKQQV